MKIEGNIGKRKEKKKHSHYRSRDEPPGAYNSTNYLQLQQQQETEKNIVNESEKGVLSID